MTPHHFLHWLCIKLITGKIFKEPFSFDPKQRRFRESIGSYRSVNFSILQSYSKSKILLAYIDFNRIYVPRIFFSLTVYNIGNWRDVKGIFLINLGKKAFKKMRLKLGIGGEERLSAQSQGTEKACFMQVKFIIFLTPSTRNVWNGVAQKQLVFFLHPSSKFVLFIVKKKIFAKGTAKQKIFRRRSNALKISILWMMNFICIKPSLLQLFFILWLLMKTGV